MCVYVLRVGQKNRYRNLRIRDESERKRERERERERVRERNCIRHRRCMSSITDTQTYHKKI